MIVWRTAEFAVTDRRVSRDEGLLTRRSSATLLTSVSDVKLNVGFIGKALGFGDLVIFTASGEAGADRFRTISHAGEFRDAIMTQKVQAESALRPPAATTQVPGPAPTQPSPPRRRPIVRRRRRDAGSSGRPARPRGDHRRGVRDQEGGDPGPDVIGGAPIAGSRPAHIIRNGR